MGLKPGVDRDHALAHLRALMPECGVYTTPELSRLTRLYYLTNTGIGGSFGFSISIAVLIGVVIVTLTMYASVLGRTRDFAVMRALGARRRDVAVVVLCQALMVSIIGIFLGFLCLAVVLNITRGTDIPRHFPLSVPPLLAGLTLVVSLLASLVALRKALQADPAAVFH